jgi:hypothetical protein
MTEDLLADAETFDWDLILKEELTLVADWGLAL